MIPLWERFTNWRLGSGWLTDDEVAVENDDDAYFEDRYGIEGVEHGLDEPAYFEGDEDDDEGEDWCDDEPY